MKLLIFFDRYDKITLYIYIIKHFYLGEAKTMEKTEKNLGLDFVVCLLSCIIAFISHGLTDQLLEVGESNTINIYSFYRGAFIFLAPCAIEAIELITSTKKGNRFDVFELIVGVIGIVLTGYLLYEIIIEKNAICVQVISLLLLIYPLKFVVHLVDDFLILIKNRNRID